MSDESLKAEPAAKLTRKERALRSYRQAKARLQKLETAERKAERAKERRAHLLVGDLVLKNFDKSSLLRKFVKRVLQQEGPNSDVAKLFASQKPTKRETQQRGQTKLQRHKAEAAGSS